MAVVIEAPAVHAAPAGHDLGTALALDSLGLPADHYDPFTPLPSRVVQGILALSGLITGIVWLARLTGRG
jgi:hypothetical protein